MRTRLFGTVLLLLTIIFLTTACTSTNKLVSTSDNDKQANVSSSGENTLPKSTVSEEVHTIKIGSASYEVSYPPGKERYFNAISTPEGILWNPAPPMEGQYLQAHPISPFTLYLSPSTVIKLETNHAQKILVLPLQMDSPIGKMNVFLGSLFATNDWVVYEISLASPGMNQAYLSKLYAVNLTDKKNIYITDFHVGGGYQFGLGIKDNILLYDQWVPNSQNDFMHIIHTFDLNTGKQSEVPAIEVKMQNEDYIYNNYVFKMDTSKFVY